MSSETTESAGMFELLAWLEVNKKRLGIGCGVAIVIGFAFYTSSVAAERKEQEASHMLLGLQTYNDGSDASAPSNPSPAAYLKVAADFSGTKAAERAALLAAESYFQEKEFAKAQEQFEKFRREFPDSEFGSSAAFGVAASLDALNKLPEAAAAYQEVISRYGNSPVVNQAKLSLARLQEASNKPDLALKLYDELVNPSAYNSFASQAGDLRERLLAKNPALAALSTVQKPISVTTNAAGQRVTLTPVSTTKTTNAKPEIKVTPQSSTPAK